MGLIFYSQGFRFDLRSFRIDKAGAIYLETTPRSAEIYLNDIPYKNASGLFQSGTFISHVFPGKYRLVIKKENYFDFEKHIEVLPAQVNRLINIILAKKAYESELLFEKIQGEEITDVSGERIITFHRSTGNFYLYSRPVPLEINLTAKISSLLKQKLEAVRFIPEINDFFLAKTKKGIYAISLRPERSQLLSSSPDFFSIFKQNLFTITASSSKTSSQALISIIDLGLLTKIRGQIILLHPGQKISSADFFQNSGAFILNDGSLLFFPSLESTPLKLAHSAQKALFSPDGKKIFFQDKDGKSFIYFIADEIYTLDLPKESFLRMSFISAPTIVKTFWHADSFHFILHYPNRAILAELTTQEPNNHFILKEGVNDIFYYPQQNSLFLLEKGNITRLSIK